MNKKLSVSAQNKQALLDTIEQMAAKVQNYCKNPEKAFTRTRKIPFDKLILLLLGMTGSPLNEELTKAFKGRLEAPSPSAYIQQRQKLLPCTMQKLFENFNKKLQFNRRFENHRLIAVDGSDIRIPLDTNDKKTHIENGKCEKGYNLLHLNTLYDICNQTFIDATIQPRLECNEHAALIQMLDRQPNLRGAIFLADRGYEAYNNLAHLEEMGAFYLIRIKHSFTKGIMSGLRIPEDSCDKAFHLMLTHSRAQSLVSNPSYRRIGNRTNFDFLKSPNDVYNLRFRVVCFPLSNGEIEALVTNLPADRFPPSALKKLYAMRWGIETAYRHIKYSLGLAAIRSKKVEAIVHEIFAALIVFNFTMGIVRSLAIPVKTRQYAYQIDLSYAFRRCKQFIGSHSDSNIEIEACILRWITPVRPDRHFSHKTTSQRYTSFAYRLA